MPTRDIQRTLPVLDIRRFETDRAEFLADLREAARDTGFFYLEGHGVPPTLIEEVLTLSRRFFALPEKDKLAIEMVNSPHFRGYNRAGFEHTRGKPDWREQLDVALDATVPVLSLPPELASEARGLTQDPLNPLFREAGKNYLKSRLRSHPDVARRHYADLLDPAQKQLEPASAY